MEIRRRLPCLLLAFGLSLFASAFGQSLSLVSDDVHPRSTPEGRGFEDLILKEAFGRLGLSIRTGFLPSERALINVNRGIDDGLYVKIAGVEQKYPNLVMVPESVCSYEFAAFGTDPSIRVEGYESLAGRRVAYIRGWKNPEAGLAEARLVTAVRDDEALFDMLLGGRAEVIVYEALQGRVRIAEKGLAGVRQLGPPLAVADMFLYLNVRHRGLVEGLAGALRAMKADGSWRRIVDSAVAGL